MEKDSLYIVTHEKMDLQVTVSDSGWFASSKSGQYDPQESFESLFMTISPSFKDRFHESLFYKLSVVSCND